jgi:hypothetical protein
VKPTPFQKPCVDLSRNQDSHQFDLHDPLGITIVYKSNSNPKVKKNLTNEQTTHHFLANKQFECFLLSPQACQGLFLGGCDVKQKIDADGMFFLSRLINQTN